MSYTAICSLCKERQPLDNFGIDRHRKNGHDHKCKPCKKMYAMEYNKRPESIILKYKHSLKHRYGMSVNQWSYLYDTQEGKCGICNIKLEDRFRNIEGSRAQVDHCHSLAKIKEVNKTIRGLLCGKCNTGLGFFNDSPTLLIKAINYINKFHEDFYERETEEEKTEEYGEGEESQRPAQEYQYSFYYKEST